MFFVLFFELNMYLCISGEDMCSRLEFAMLQITQIITSFVGFCRNVHLM